MSQPTRFSVRAVTFDDGTASVIHSSDVDGEYVLHADYARLKAEVERLRKAGDAMIEEWWMQLSCPERMKASWLKEPQIAEWLAAKGGQS